MPQLSAPLWSSPPPAQEAPISLCWARAHMGSPPGDPRGPRAARTLAHRGRATRTHLSSMMRHMW